MYKTIHLSNQELTDVLDALDLASRCCTERMEDELPGFRRALIEMSDRYDKIREAIGKGLLGDPPISALSSGQEDIMFAVIELRIANAKETGCKSIIVPLRDDDDLVAKIRDAGYGITDCGTGMFTLSWEEK